MASSSVGKSRKIELTGKTLNLNDIDLVAKHHAKVTLSSSAIQQIEDSAKVVSELFKTDQPVYGVNTGFGVFSNKRIAPELTNAISRNLVLSHAVAVGPPLPEAVVRAAMLIRANTLSQGHSGVRLEIIESLLAMLNQGVTPIVPSQGSLGSSGDLALLAHLVLVLADVTDENNPAQSGNATYQGNIMTGQEAMQAAQIPRPVLGPKEGLALTNGATFSAGIVALDLIDARKLLLTTELAAAMTFDALLGVPDALDPRVHAARLHPGQIGTAERMLKYLNGSDLIGSLDKIQDAYSLRCTPQIIGPTWEAWQFSNNVIQREVNAVTDNPIIFDNVVLSGGNFHGQPVGMVADFMKIALTEISNLSERRTYRLLAADKNEGLPPMLIPDPSNVGLHSGLMMLQYTAASLCLENQVLATPSSTHSLPTSAGQEDHNANATTATRHLGMIINNMFSIVAIELICAAQALDIRLSMGKDLKAGKTVRLALKQIRGVSAFVHSERPMAADIDAVAELIRSGTLLESAGIDDAML
jgi:histidine ammonia-lyase